MGKYDLLYNTERFLTKNQKKNKSGNSKKAMPALIKEKPLPPRADSSDDELPPKALPGPGLRGPIVQSVSLCDDRGYKAAHDAVVVLRQCK